MKLDLEKFRGKKASDVALELEKLGYRVKITVNSKTKQDEKTCLVCLARAVSEEEIELICGDFIFLS